MTIIAVGGIRFRRSLDRVMKLLAPVINGPFEALNFVPGNKGTKICYIRLSQELNPIPILKRINATKTATFKPYAFLPTHVPELQIASKPRTYPAVVEKGARVTVLTIKQLLEQTHNHIMREMQSKYTGLYELAKENEPKGHPQLIHKIGEVVYKRLIEIKQSRKSGTVFQLSKVYRKKHPHFADFQFILSTLHQLQDAEGKPRVQLEESELIVIRVMPIRIDTAKYDKAKATREKYIDKITVKVLEHIKNLPTNVNPANDSREEAARNKVREQINKLVPYLPSMINEVIISDVKPEDSDYRLVYIYGEPCLPGREMIYPWLRRHNAYAVTRKRDLNMFNLLTAKVSPDSLVTLLEADGAVVGDSTLVIRPSDVPFYKININDFIEETTTAANERLKPETKVQ